MTVKELANIAGVSDETIRRAGKRIYPTELKNGVKTDFNDIQSQVIMMDVRKKNMVATQNEEISTHIEKVDYEIIGKMIGMAVSAAMQPVVNQLQNISNPALQIEGIKQDYYSIKGYNNLKKLKLTFSECLSHGKKLSSISKERDIEIRKVSDERFGEVNSYSAVILDEYFSI